MYSINLEPREMAALQQVVRFAVKHIDSINLERANRTDDFTISESDLQRLDCILATEVRRVMGTARD